MSGERRYPIYTIRARWSQDGEHDARYPRHHEGLPEGRIWNGTDFERMYREDPGLDAATADAREWWTTHGLAKRGDKNPSAPEITVELRWREEWCLSWFAHWTFDVGQSDAEALASFDAFVDRARRFNRENGRVEGGRWTEPYCLMGAEDRWRWRGVNDSPAPCRCDGCRAQGIIRIVH